MSANIALVAGGEGGAGFKDGSFTSALFNTPLGLAISDEGTRLFVADSGNNRIRIIHLDQNNEVTTLAGQDLAGKLDGPLTMAQFSHPCGVLYLSGDRLVVNDYGNQLFRLVDLKAGTVTTLAGGPANLDGTSTQSSSATLSTGPAAQVGMKGVRDMAYMPAANSILYTQPESGSLKMLDLKTHLVSTVLNSNILLPNPAALWCQGNKLYVADKDLLQVYEMDWKDKTFAKPMSVAVPLAKVLSLSLNGEVLYALVGTPGVPAERFFINGQYFDNEYKEGYNARCNGKLVTFRNPWGDTIPQEDLFPLQDRSFVPSIGFVPDPWDHRKFYVSKPDYNMVVSFRDLFGFDWNPAGAGERNSNGVGGSEYPAQKPKNTYRIIMVGDSRSAEVQDYPFQTDYHAQKRPADFPYYPRNLGLAPQIEQELNFQAALDGVPLNYEVFNFSRHGEFFIWPTYAVPDVVKRNDIDLVVIFMTARFPPDNYFDHPITSDGIPQYPNDMEYYLKPPLERIPDGIPRKFYDICKAHNLVTIDGNNIGFDLGVFSCPELHESLVELYGRPLDRLNRKLSGMKTSKGQPVRLLLCYTFTERLWDSINDVPIWREAAKKFNFPIMDLGAEMNALHYSFFPLTSDGSHLNPNGSNFFGRLIAHDLIRDQWIPWNKGPHQ